jgi:O-antigen ligase
MIKYSIPARAISEKKDLRSESQVAGLKAEYHRSVYSLFLFFTLYITLPIIDLPLMSLSLSAPIFFLVALPVLVRPASPWLAAYRRWIFIAAFIWVGILISAILNGLFSGGVKIDRDSLVALVQCAYWLLVFIVTIYLVSSQKDLIMRITAAIALGVVVLGFLRLGEALFGGAIGAWSRLRVMSPNGYAIQFSMFYPMLMPFVYWGTKRKFAAVGALAVLAAILINGSRGGWLAAVVSTVVFLFMHFHTQRRRGAAAAVTVSLLGMLVLAAFLAPQEVTFAFQDRFSTFQRLEEDKSYALRQVMIQKGIRLFQSSRWIGVGVSRWQKETVALDIPQILRYSRSNLDARSSHNSYVSYLAENGILGTSPLALLLLVLIARGYRAASRLAARGHIWALGIYAGFIGMSIHLWALSGLTGTATWFVYGLLAGVIVLDRRANA